VNGVCVLLYVADPPVAPGSVEAAYHRVSQALAQTPGLKGNTLLRSIEEPLTFAVLSEWADLGAFKAWEQGTRHRTTTADLRPFQAARGDSPFGVYEIVASY
jgi:heme-degrading monooxygenase HmoA